MIDRRVRVLGLALLMISFSVVVAGATTFSLTQDWSSVQNPNGVWSLNDNLGPIPTPVIWGEGGASPGWSRGFIPVWFQASADYFEWQAGDIVTHVGYGPEFSAVTWTSPGAGIYSVSGGLWHVRDIDRWTQWTLSVNGVPIQNGVIGSLMPDSRANPNLFGFSNRAMASGDVVEMRLQVIQNGQVGQGTPDYAGVTFEVSSRNVVPEPASLLLLGTGLVGLRAWRKRR